MVFFYQRFINLNYRVENSQMDAYAYYTDPKTRDEIQFIWYLDL